MIRVEPEREDLQLNMAPMIDMVFLLIIFFLTATTFTEREREQDVLLPVNRTPGSLSRNLDNNVIVNIKEDGSIFVLGRAIEPFELASLVREKRALLGARLKVHVRADRRTFYGNVARALQAIENGGVARPYIDTKLVGAGGAGPAAAAK